MKHPIKLPFCAADTPPRDQTAIDFVPENDVNSKVWKSNHRVECQANTKQYKQSLDSSSSNLAPHRPLPGAEK